MPVTRLSALVMLFASCAGLAWAQSQRNDASNLVVFQGTASMNTGTDGSDLKANLESQVVAPQSKAEHNSLLAEARDQWGNSHDASQGFALGPESDRTCYFIRDYVVIRDSPHSDSTHRDGSFTCVPGSRFRVYTTAGHALKAEK
jgi:hypothetical protein